MHPFCVCTWLIINLLLPLERNEALPSCRPASSRTCQVKPVPTACDHSQGWHSPRSSRMQRVLSSMDNLCTVMDCPDTHSVFTAPPGTKVSNVQFGRNVDLCHGEKKKRKNIMTMSRITQSPSLRVTRPNQPELLTCAVNKEDAAGHESPTHDPGDAMQ